MKKIILILLVCISQTSLFAQSKAKDAIKQNQIDKDSFEVEINQINRDFTSGTASVGFIDEKKRSEITLNRELRALYKNPIGSLIQSLLCIEPNYFGSYLSQEFIGAAFTVPWVFQNKSTDAEEYQWGWNGGEWSTEKDAVLFSILEDETSLDFLLPGYYEAPGLTALWGSQSHYYKPPSFEEFETKLSASSTNAAGHYVSNADFYGNTSDLYDNYSSFWNIEATGSTQHNGNGAGWFFGTAYRPDINTRVANLVSFYEKPMSPMLIKDVSYLCKTNNFTTPIDPNFKFKIVVYKLNEDGNLLFIDDVIINEVLAEGFFKGSEVIIHSNAGCIFNFIFWDKDIYSFLPPEKYFVVDDPFAIVFYDVDLDDNDFGVFSDKGNELERSSFFTMRDMGTGELVKSDDGAVALYNSDESSLNMYAMLNVHFPYLYIDPGYELLFIDVGGGYAVDKDGDRFANFYSEFDFNVGEDNFVKIESHSKWFEHTTNSSFYQNNGILQLDFTASELPQDVTGRAAQIKVHTYGAEIIYTLIQGDTYPVTFIILDADTNELIEKANITVNFEEIYGDSTYLPSGTYNYTVDKPGYFDASEEFIVGNEHVFVNVFLNKKPIYNVSFQIVDKETEQPLSDVLIHFNGKYLPGTSTDVNSGSYPYYISKNGYKNIPGSVIVENEDVVVSIKLEKSDDININLNPVSDFILYPNPFTNEIYISHPDQVKNVEIFNIAGQKAKDTIFNGKTIITENLSSGIYFVIIERKTGEKSVTKLVK